MNTNRAQLARGRVDRSRDHVGGEDVSGMRIRIAEEICEGDSGEGVVVRECRFVEFHHCNKMGCASLLCSSCWVGALVMHLRMEMRRR